MCCLVLDVLTIANIQHHIFGMKRKEAFKQAGISQVSYEIIVN